MDKPLSRAIKKVQKNKKVDEAIITGTLAALGKGAAIAGKALTKGAAVIGKAGSATAKAGTKAAKTGTKVAKGMAKGSKTATKKLSLKDRMAQAADKNKDLIKNKRGLPSNNMANSGKKTVDPKKIPPLQILLIIHQRKKLPPQIILLKITKTPLQIKNEIKI